MPLVANAHVLAIAHVFTGNVYDVVSTGASMYVDSIDTNTGSQYGSYAGSTPIINGMEFTF